MGRRKIPMGKCSCCGDEFSKTAIAKHIQSCEDYAKSSGTNKAKVFHLAVEGYHLPEYWIYLEARTDAKLKYLDDFLRNIWLECCGHMSEFEIGKTRYGADFSGELGQKSLNIQLAKILCVGMEFSHKYDFGSTTELILQVVSEQQGNASGKPIKLLARNNPLEIKCESCGQTATQLCTECMWSNKGGVFCDKCAETHKCDSEMFLPIVNSPRVGVCGYTGY
jgi:hypothetical protein